MRRFGRGLVACALALASVAGTAGWAAGDIQTAVTGPPPGTKAWTADRMLGTPLPDPASATPDQVARFFAGLTAARRTALAERHPLVVGGLDGAPPELRYAANARALITGRDRALARAVDPEQPDGARREARARAAAYDELLAPGRHILALDPRGRGQVAEVYGDLLTARRVAVLVPGSDTDLASYDAAAGMARNLRAEMTRLSPADRPAVIVWVGYTTPVGVGWDAATGHLAEEGAPRLLRFLDGLAATTHPAAPPAVFCHSYGSVLCGAAAHRMTGRQGSDLVAVASPGMRLDHAGQVAVGKRAHLWATARNATDWIHRVPPVELLGLGHGADPADPAFGARVVSSDRAEGHAGYFTPGTASLTNYAAIALGDYAAVTCAHPTAGTPTKDCRHGLR
ncbi:MULTISPECIES: alpha/beta hydrolase [Streptomyces]|uniref:alpha/beta hydrolase n=1 Tax=Streptomyces scabiei TaxID=1930 RepID=UPI001B317F18|nr:MULTISPECIES: alpha/beta hydrolase [Streptomyces]MDX2684664.1 alpha/beta hydrolase [Streptomyces scabiei]MDX2750831.1 alpha/beta hydrolase [Streptomyces scabiei]MDX2805112.1 alpha/beta hydrolase [Streptomyces scabiei]MDX3028310.1 alpha/beta hydrolase [Streptomyces scabiei]MDX3121539.1 alpha/beta hydrolase [Streptomyces scabiei]